MNEELLLMLVKNKLAEAEMRQGCTDYSLYAQELIDEACPIIEKQAHLDGYAEGFTEGANKGVLIGGKQERERILKLLPEITTRFDHNKTCVDCISRIRRQVLTEEK